MLSSLVYNEYNNSLYFDITTNHYRDIASISLSDSVYKMVLNNSQWDERNTTITNNEAIDLKYNQDSVMINWDIIHNKINSEIASSLWGKDYGYHIKLGIDKPFQSALKNFNLAKELIK